MHVRQRPLWMTCSRAPAHRWVCACVYACGCVFQRVCMCPPSTCTSKLYSLQSMAFTALLLGTSHFVLREGTAAAFVTAFCQSVTLHFISLYTSVCTSAHAGSHTCTQHTYTFPHTHTHTHTHIARVMVWLPLPCWARGMRSVQAIEAGP